MRKVPPVLALFLGLLALLAGACRTTLPPAGPPGPPTRVAAVTVAAPVGPPSPTKTVPTRPAATAAPTTSPAHQSPTYGPAVWTLTVLHTGEVYGDVLPCG